MRRSGSYLLAGLVLAILSAGFCAGTAGEAYRAARSVHLGFVAAPAEVFYNELCVEESVRGSYFMACGWDTGYFGIQELANGEKVVLFSVWDPTRGDDPKAVKPESRVEVLAQGEGVRVKRFGGEGTGAQCLAPFAWKSGETNRFVVYCAVEGATSAYTAWVWQPGKRAWWKLATFRTRTGGAWLRGYYSFVEDFRRDFKSAGETRRAAFGHGWVREPAGTWSALDRARFTASNATWESPDNIDAGVGENGWFYLACGGAITNHTPLRTLVQLPSSPPNPPVLDFLPGPGPGKKGLITDRPGGHSSE